MWGFLASHTLFTMTLLVVILFYSLHLIFDRGWSLWVLPFVMVFSAVAIPVQVLRFTLCLFTGRRKSTTARPKFKPGRHRFEDAGEDAYKPGRHRLEDAGEDAYIMANR